MPGRSRGPRPSRRHARRCWQRTRRSVAVGARCAHQAWPSWGLTLAIAWASVTWPLPCAPPQLAKLHRDLVQSKLITEDDFWATRQSLVADALQQLQQRAGTSNALLWLVKPSSAEQYSLTPEIIKAIMIQYPAGGVDAPREPSATGRTANHCARARAWRSRWLGLRSVERAYRANVPDKVAPRALPRTCGERKERPGPGAHDLPCMDVSARAPRSSRTAAGAAPDLGDGLLAAVLAVAQGHGRPRPWA